jgi:inosine/xanthosine triphosphatase
MNGPKLEAVRAAFGAFAPSAQVQGVDVESGVSEQPVGYPEIILGATTRAARAAAAGECDFGVGIEDGLVELPGGDPSAPTHLNVGCAAVTDGVRTSIGFSSGFAYPPGCAEPALRDREPIGDLFDRFWRDARPQSGSASQGPTALSTGNIGKLSDGALPRSEYARHGVLCALVAFLQPDLYEANAGH